MADENCNRQAKLLGATTAQGEWEWTSGVMIEPVFTLKTVGQGALSKTLQRDRGDGAPDTRNHSPSKFLKFLKMAGSGPQG